MLQVSDVELPDTAISSNRREDVPLPGEVDIIDLLVMCDELGKYCRFFDVPDGAGSIDAGSTD